MNTAEHPIDWTDEKVSRLWDYYSRNAQIRDMYFSKIYGGVVIRKSRLPRSRNLRVLDFGCGPGHMWDHMKLARVKWRYMGLDFSADSVAGLGIRGASRPGFDGAVHVTSLPAPLDSGVFDAALLLEVVEHLTDERLLSTLSEIRRLLKPGGVLVVTTPNAEDLQTESQFCPECCTVFHRWQHVRSWTPDSLRAVMVDCGFVHGHTWCGNWSDHWWYGWLFNRAARLWLKRRLDPHMLATFTRPES